MKNKLARLRRWMESHRVTNVILNGARALWGLLSHNLGLKALSLLMAVLLWNFVITSNTTITRTQADQIAFDLPMSGEGMTWSEPTTLTLLDNGKALVRVVKSPADRATTDRYSRCPA